MSIALFSFNTTKIRIRVKIKRIDGQGNKATKQHTSRFNFLIIISTTLLSKS